MPHPFTSPNHPCRGCFLEQQRGGRVCPAAREIHGLPDVGAERRAAPLHAAILRDASPAPCRRRPGARIYEVILALYLVRRRLHVSEFRIEVRREAAAIRRQLRAELDDLRRQEGAS